MKEALKLALGALETLHDENMDYLVRNKLGGENNQCMVFARDVIKSIKRTLAQDEPWCMKMNGCTSKCEDCPVEVVEQEPVAWKTMEAKYPSLEKLDIRMGDGSILCDVWPQSDGDFWWAGSGTGEKFIDPKYADVTHWRVHSDTTPPQPEERNFCPRCGKRTADLTVIHTCTPPQENT